MSAALQDLFGGAVVAVETRSAELDESLLWREEADALGEVVAGRRWDYVSGRRCARLAIDRLGVDPAPVLRGAKREPVWPPGVVGAITHTHGYAAAAVAKVGLRRAVGIDAEPDAELPPGVLARIAFDDELDWLADAGDSVGVASPDRLIFSVKEAVYKAWYPLAREWLGFEDARIVFDTTARRFRVTILKDGPLTLLEGGYASIDGIILSAIEVPP